MIIIFNSCENDSIEEEFRIELDFKQFISYMSAVFSILSEQVRHT